MEGVLAIAISLAATGTTGNNGIAPQHCQKVHARYAVYSNRDALWVVGSKHILDVSIDALDKVLQARGWENTVAYGDFMVCTDRQAGARALTINDPIVVTRA